MSDFGSENFPHEEVLGILDYPESFRQNECILPEKMKLQKTTTAPIKSKVILENNRLLKNLFFSERMHSFCLKLSG